MPVDCTVSTLQNFTHMRTLVIPTSPSFETRSASKGASGVPLLDIKRSVLYRKRKREGKGEKSRPIREIGRRTDGQVAL